MRFEINDGDAVEALLKAGFSDDVISQQTGASLLSIIAKRAEAAVRPIAGLRAAVSAGASSADEELA